MKKQWRWVGGERVTDENSRIRSSGSGSISQRYGSADPDPDPYRNFMDPSGEVKPLYEAESPVGRIRIRIH
jgi:hypothetical protein